MTTICDTSGLLAVFDRDEPKHAACAAVLPALMPPFVVSPYVIAELDHLLCTRHGGHTARVVLDELASGAYELAGMGRGDLSACAAIDERHGDLGLGLADASLVVLAERWHTHDLLTLDERHFRAVAANDGQPFRLHPAGSI